MCLISGPPGVFVTLMGVTGQTFSPRTSTAGSGAPTRPRCRPPTETASTTGRPPEGMLDESACSGVEMRLHYQSTFQSEEAAAGQPRGRRVVHGGPQQLLRRRHQVARRRLQPREAHRLRGRRGTPQLRQADLPQHQDPLNRQAPNPLLIRLSIFFEHTNIESPSEQTNLTQHALPFKCTVLFSKLDSTHRGPVQNLETDGRREKSDTLRICNGLWIRNLEYFSKGDRVCAARTERAKLNHQHQLALSLFIIFIKYQPS